jgi:hypothetical protein
MLTMPGLSPQWWFTASLNFSPSTPDTFRAIQGLPLSIRQQLQHRPQHRRKPSIPPEPLLRGSLAVLPFAPISVVTEGELPGIIKHMERRLSQRPARRQAPLVWASSFILLGLRYTPALATQLFRGVLSMKESSTYQLILEEGRAEGQIAEARKVLRLQGEAAFGPPDARTTAFLERQNDLSRLEAFLTRMRTATSWHELFSLPASRTRKGRRG